MSYEFAERDLLHIRAVLEHLEHTTDEVLARRAVNGISLNYWRARVRAVLAMPLLPFHLQKQSKMLLARLDRLDIK